MSDSHGRAGRVRRALAVLDTCGAELFVHCGDIGGLEVLEEFTGRRCWFVWGNMDRPRPVWRAELAELNLPWPDGQCTIELDGKRIAVFHGHEPGFREALEGGEYDYVLFGHSHRPAEARNGRTRIINPGALHRASVHTVALLDIKTDELEFININTFVLT
jgi:putative phosphoesterase